MEMQVVEMYMVIGHQQLMEMLDQVLLYGIFLEMEYYVITLLTMNMLVEFVQ